ncbi:MAG: cadmium-translocating P-type ATPase [Oligoflexia bacterium]|nr:cadmium-translocating P-type ATPase [Oligoflexia bacterium]
MHELSIDGMTCSNCARGVENALRELGVSDPSVNFTTGTASFGLPEHLSLPNVIKAIEDAGFRVVAGGEEDARPAWWTTLEAKLAFSLIWTIPLAAHMFSSWHVLHDGYVQLALCLPVFILGLRHFGHSALGSLRNGAANMDVLIVLGITAAFIYSLVGVLANLGPSYLFFETTATITSIVLLGNLLEKLAVRRTTSALRELSKLQSVPAKRIVLENGSERIEEIASSQVAIDDVCVLGLGDAVPADGIVISGAASIDESMVSGESAPVAKEAGDQLIGGTIVQSGNLRMRAVAIGERTVLAQMIRLVKNAQHQKPSIQRIGDKVSSIFVPAVSILSVLTLVVSWLILDLSFGTALMRSIAVLVVACPCAMGLATPTAVMVGISLAARRGILLKGGQTLETLASLKHIIFDKTGTLTSGDFRISGFKVFSGTEQEARAAIAALEQSSSHPLAKALYSTFNGDSGRITLTEIHETRGVGVSGIDSSGRRYEIGAARYAPQAFPQDYDLFLARDGKLIAAIQLGDAVKAEAKAALSALKERGLRLSLLSGDRESKARQTAEDLGLDTYYAQKSPQEKLDILHKHEAEMPTGYVGDGINDGPALAQARVGISLSNASQVAVESAQVVLLNGNLKLLVSAYDIARLSLKTIKQNLFWAFLYNTLMIPAASAGYLTPSIAAFSMAFSDVVVIANSLRIRFTSRY